MRTDQPGDAFPCPASCIERCQHGGVIVPQDFQKQGAGQFLLRSEEMKEASIRRPRARIAATVAPSKPSRSNTARAAASKSSRAVVAMVKHLLSHSNWTWAGLIWTSEAPTGWRERLAPAARRRSSRAAPGWPQRVVGLVRPARPHRWQPMPPAALREPP